MARRLIGVPWNGARIAGHDRIENDGGNNSGRKNANLPPGVQLMKAWRVMDESSTHCHFGP
jgi:hypothetical protein